MKLESYINKIDFLKTKFEENLKPKIYERINNGEIKVVLSKDYINDALNNRYEIGYLFLKLKEILLDTNLNISIRKLKKEFVFYEKFDGINRECDVFKTNFKKNLEPKILKILKHKHSIIFEESFLKEYLNIKYSTDRIYKKLRDILLNTDILISLKKNIRMNNNKSNHFIFYRKDETIIETQNHCEEINFNEEIDSDKDDFKNYMEESTKENNKIKEEIHKESLKGLLETLNSDIDNYCECPVCKSKIKDFSNKCEHCDTKLEWR